MERKYLEALLGWKDDPRRKPLMVWGARQVGKTYLIEDLFAKVYYSDSYLRIDCSDDDDFVEYVESNNSLSKVISYIQVHYDFPLDSNHLLIIDEAQECLPIVKMMKHFCEKRRDIPIIVTGSLVRLKIQREAHKRGGYAKKGFLFPVGKMNQLYIFPMTFDEYLANANGSAYRFLQENYRKREALDPKLHEEMMSLFEDYLFLGGMPEVVDTFLLYRDDRAKALREAVKKIGEVFDDYLSDMNLYQASPESIIRSRLIYSNIYSQLNKENKNFKVSRVEEGSKTRDMVSPIGWLTTAQVAHKAYQLKERVSLPLVEDEESLFRLYLSDMGMFTYQSGLSASGFTEEKGNSMSGIFYENYLACELAARRIKLFYWKGKRDSELEFIVDGNGVAVPFDVKKKKGSLSSLEEFRAHNKKALAVKVSSNQFGYDAEKKLLTLPFYYVPFFLDDLQKGAINELG